MKEANILFYMVVSVGTLIALTWIGKSLEVLASPIFMCN